MNSSQILVKSLLFYQSITTNYIDFSVTKNFVTLCFYNSLVALAPSTAKLIKLNVDRNSKPPLKFYTSITAGAGSDDEEVMVDVELDVTRGLTAARLPSSG